MTADKAVITIVLGALGILYLVRRGFKGVAI